MQKGLDAIRDSLSSRSGFEGGGLPELTIQAGEIALIHFLSDRDEIIEARFHRVPETVQGGLSIAREKFCKRDIGEDCSYCSHPSEDIRRRTLRWYAWTWLYSLLVPEPVEGAQTLQRGRRMLYVWEINAAAILRKGEGQQKYLINQVLTHEERFGTLCDRAFEWERTGAKRDDTSYLLSPLPELMAKPGGIELQSLEEIITKELSLSSFPSRAKQQPEEGAAPATVESTSSLMKLLRGGGDKPKL